MILRPFLLLLLGGGAALPAQDLPAPTIRAAQEFSFPTADGAVYTVEGSADGKTWTPLAGPIFGDGSLARSLVGPAGTAPPLLRARAVDAAAYGPSTPQLGGKTLVLNDQGRARQLIFFPSIQGVRRGVLKTDAAHARSFLWQARRTSGNKAVAELRYFDGTTSEVDLSFSNEQLGSYQMRDLDQAGVPQGTEGGGFSLHAGRIRDAPSDAVLPATLAGQSLLLEEGGLVTRFDFAADGSVGLFRPDGSTELRRFQFNRTAPGQAELRVEALGGLGAIYQLQLSTQATGKYERMPLPLSGGGFPSGFLPRPGTFNVPTLPVVANSTTGPPRSLGGKVLQLNGEDPVTLTFHSDGTGTATREEEGSVEVTPFSYNYAPTDEDEASLALTYPGAQTDHVEDYNLDFSDPSSGTYRTSKYNGGELARSSSGSFNTGGS